ncbi:hypothetical protein GCM10010112_84820 [Actinoplanes lobatus]|uniref:Uncharacterized protein n=1 Tax=Actinoplanes lobatus TaxID=113568 RepID=A0A7W7MJ87_9ACTN|nr:hypothetical protein [Actinoplanes lobatus]MBB4752387.1 hypothetical protein [Actinoplanes lobatus]GGN95007.1 hypothetical protein GCM10010112_84820 [Actinoplanes lobatus]GIE46100.1 hypothetical protein Alo02nite_89980 [Actinoplanes lobatus]
MTTTGAAPESRAARYWASFVSQSASRARACRTGSLTTGSGSCAAAIMPEEGLRILAADFRRTAGSSGSVSAW